MVSFIKALPSFKHQQVFVSERVPDQAPYHMSSMPTDASLLTDKLDRHMFADRHKCHPCCTGGH